MNHHTKHSIKEVLFFFSVSLSASCLVMLIAILLSEVL